MYKVICSTCILNEPKHVATWIPLYYLLSIRTFKTPTDVQQPKPNTGNQGEDDLPFEMPTISQTNDTYQTTHLKTKDT